MNASHGGLSTLLLTVLTLECVAQGPNRTPSELSAPRGDAERATASTFESVAIQPSAAQSATQAATLVTYPVDPEDPAMRELLRKRFEVTVCTSDGTDCRPIDTYDVALDRHTKDTNASDYNETNWLTHANFAQFDFGTCQRV